MATPNNEPPERLSFGALIKTFFADLANADRGMLGTVVKLTTYPNEVVDTYLFKDRARFIRPTRYFLFALSVVAASYFVVQLRFGEPLHDFLMPFYEQEYEAGRQQMLDALLAQAEDNNAQAEEFARWYTDAYTSFLKKMTKWFIQYSSYFSLLFIPLNALLYYFVFPRKDYNYTETIVATAYTSAHATLFSVFLIPFFLILSDPFAIAKAYQAIGFLQMAYLLYAIVRVWIDKPSDVLLAIGIQALIFLGIIAFVGQTLYVGGYLKGAMGSQDGLSLKHYLRIIPVIGIGLVVTGGIIARFAKTWRWTIRFGIAGTIITIAGFVLVAISKG
ncbi:DUF3667 domain-containing protein [Lewinella sp. 4G2]|uniref:DUF3667 domain-containing protein n=1 Tax=Lewinella sp. 4G2 TaxID=1803372 RepID=UPI0012F82644|nr:DUF3667 domain-containing protein [Lewinella sp. 4G2]